MYYNLDLYNEEIKNFAYAVHQKVELKRNYILCCDKYQKLQQTTDHTGFSLQAILKFDKTIENALHNIESEVHFDLRKIKNKAEKLNVAIEIKNLLSFMEIYWQQANFSNISDVEALEKKLRKFDAEYGEVLQNNLRVLLNEVFKRPKSRCDELAFFKLDVLLLGLQNLMRQIFFISEQFAILADRYFQRGDTGKCNEIFNIIYEHFEVAKAQLYGNDEEHGFIKKIKTRFENVTSNSYTNTNSKQTFCEKLKRLKFYENIFTAAGTPIFLDQPPKITKKLDFTKSKIQTPTTAWQQHSKVSYAIQYQDGNFYSKFSEWSEPHSITDKGNPKINLPVYIHQGKRLIFRKFDNKRPEFVGVIEAPTQTFFQDNDRDLYNAAGLIDQEPGIEEFKKLLKNGADPNALFEDGNSAIHAAALVGNAKLIEDCLMNDARIDFNAKNSKGYTALHIAAEIGYDELVKLLLQHAVDVNLKTNNYMLTPLHLAALKNNDSVLEALLAADSIEPNAQDAQGFSPLHCAVLGGVAAVEILLENPLVDVNLESQFGLTPLHVAVLSGNIAVTETLLRSAAVDVEFITAGDLTAFHLAVLMEDIEMIKCLVTKRIFNLNACSSDQNLTALHLALSTRNENLVAELLKLRKIDFNAKTTENFSPLHLAARYNLVSTIECLLQAGANINAQTEGGLTPLHITAYFGCLEALQILVKQGADLACQTSRGLTVLHLIAGSKNFDKSLNVFEFLLENGANLYAENENQESSLHWAAFAGNLNLIKFLVEQKNFDLSKKSSDDKTPLFIATVNERLHVVKYIIENDKTDFTSTKFHSINVVHLVAGHNNLDLLKYLLEKGADINVRDSDGWSLLHFASEEDNIELIKFLVEQNEFNIHAQDCYQTNALFYAAKRESLDAVKYFIGDKKMSINDRLVTYEFSSWHQTILHRAATGNNLDLVKYLLENGADISIRDDRRWSSLHYAAEGGNMEIIKYLVEQKNVDFYAKDFQGKTPLSHALIKEHLNVVKYFVKDKKIRLENDKELIAEILFFAVESNDLDFVRYLLDNGADINVICFKENLLYRAIRNGSLNIIKFLVEEKEFDLHADIEYETALYWAALSGKIDTIKYFVKNKKTNLSEEGYNAVIDEAKKRKKHEIARRIKQLQKMK